MSQEVKKKIAFRTSRWVSAMNPISNFNAAKLVESILWNKVSLKSAVYIFCNPVSLQINTL